MLIQGSVPHGSRGCLLLLSRHVLGPDEQQIRSEYYQYRRNGTEGRVGTWKFSFKPFFITFFSGSTSILQLRDVLQSCGLDQMLQLYRTSTLSKKLLRKIWIQLHLLLIATAATVRQLLRLWIAIEAHRTEFLSLPEYMRCL